MQLVPQLAMTEQNDREGITVQGQERRESERWGSPRIILTFVQLAFTGLGVLISALGFFFVIASCVFGAYVLSQKNDVTSEMSNVQLAQQISALSTKFDKFADTQTATAQTTAREMTEVKSDVATLRRDLDNEAKSREGRDGWLEARIVSGK